MILRPLVRSLSSVFILASLLLSTACREEGGREGTLPLSATIAPATSMIASIGDSLVSVTTLLPQGNNPENYEPTPQAMQALATSRAYFYMGDLGFERSWIERIHSTQPQLQLIRLDRGLQGHTHSHATGSEAKVHDPHYWTSLRGLRAMSSEIYTSLIKLDSIHSDHYTQRYGLLKERLSQLEGKLRGLLSDLPSRAFVIYHPSLSEFADEWGLEQLVVEEDGKDPTPQHIEGVIRRARESGVRVVFIQQEFDSKLIQSIASELGAETITINPLDGDWEKQLLLIAEALRGASRAH